MSEIKVNKITPRVACGTTQLGDSGDTFTIPSGATITNLGTATGFGGTGVVSWETGSIKTTGFTAVTGTGYFCNTTGGAFTVTLPLSPSAGDVVGVSDYAQTFDTANLTLGRNGSNIAGGALDSVISTEGVAVTLVYVDATKGWIVTDSGNQSEAPGPVYVAATGGCITTCGNYKVHLFNSPGTFCVSQTGNPAGSTAVDYLIVAGGGGGSSHGDSSSTVGGGGGAGGYRYSTGTASGCYAAGPAGGAAITVTATPYPIVAGGGGTTVPSAITTPAQGNVSSGLGLTSTGGGTGGGSNISVPKQPWSDGGSGGGSSNGTTGNCTGGTGNTPPTTPSQGNDGGMGEAPVQAGGGGGAANAGSPGNPPALVPGNTGRGGGGIGLVSCITFAPVQRGGGGGGANTDVPDNGGAGGGGKSWPGASGGTGCSGAIYTGGGGGGGPHSAPSANAGNGGGGVVVIRYKYQ